MAAIPAYVLPYCDCVDAAAPVCTMPSDDTAVWQLLRKGAVVGEVRIPIPSGIYWLDGASTNPS